MSHENRLHTGAKTRGNEREGKHREVKRGSPRAEAGVCQKAIVANDPGKSCIKTSKAESTHSKSAYDRSGAYAKVRAEQEELNNKNPNSPRRRGAGSRAGSARAIMPRVRTAPGNPGFRPERGKSGPAKTKMSSGRSKIFTKKVASQSGPRRCHQGWDVRTNTAKREKRGKVEINEERE